MPYVASSEMIDYIRSSITADVVEIEAAQLAADSVLNAHCHRVFTVPTVATTRTFVASDSYALAVPDIANTTGLVVVDNGTTITAAGYQLEIAHGVTGPIDVSGRTWPYSIIRRVSGSWSSNSDGDDVLSITARWGWPATPPEVLLASKLLTRDLMLARDTAFGIVQVGDFSRRVAANGVVETLLAPLRRVESFGLA